MHSPPSSRQQRWTGSRQPILLFYNDYGAEGLGAKSDAVYELVQGLLERQVPVHGVGLQMHVSVNQAPGAAEITQNMDRLAALGLEVQVTELDVRIKGQATERALAQQAADYRAILSACLQAQRCTALVTWGFTDRYSWIPHVSKGWGFALPFDESYQPKPAYAAMVQALSEP